MPLVRYLSTRIAVMEHGRLVETGEAVALCDHPRQAYTRQLIAATPELPSIAPPAVRQTLAGGSH
jgi:peptide/nickel transport system ATP-binding protein